MENECCICGTTCDFSVAPRRMSEVCKLKCQQMDRAAPSSPTPALCLHLWSHLPKLGLQLLSTLVNPWAFPAQLRDWFSPGAVHGLWWWSHSSSGCRLSLRRSDFTHTHIKTWITRWIHSSYLAFHLLSLLLLFRFVKASWFDLSFS